MNANAKVGVVNGKVIPLLYPTIPNFKATQAIVPVTGADKTKGTNKVGFKTTGTPKTIGSLMLKTAGIILIFPIAFNLSDFAIKAIKRHRAKVPPVPP